MKQIEVQEKLATKKLRGKRKAKELKKLKNSSSGGLQEGFAFDAKDARFAALYEKGSSFALDPTDPKFKKTKVRNGCMPGVCWVYVECMLNTMCFF